MSDLNHGITKGQLLVDAIQVRQSKSAVYEWELADLTVQYTNSQGRPSKTSGSQMISLKDWDAQIGWSAHGFKHDALRAMTAEARAWPKELRVSEHGFWPHYEARAMFKGDVKKASAWLKDRTGNITEQARAGILGNTELSKAVMNLIKARQRIMLVVPLLASRGFQGTEGELRQLTREIEAIERAVIALRRFLADEAEISVEELESTINQILAEEAS